MEVLGIYKNWKISVNIEILRSAAYGHEAFFNRSGGALEVWLRGVLYCPDLVH